MAPCPRSYDSGDCLKEKNKWICWKCQTSLDYGFDGYLYCKCGAGKIENFSFRCNSEKHCGGYFFFKKIVIRNLLDNLQAFNGLTILILGETGVGKSTFINGFANYLQYETLEEAKEMVDTFLSTEFEGGRHERRVNKIACG